MNHECITLCIYENCVSLIFISNIYLKGILHAHLVIIIININYEADNNYYQIFPFFDSNNIPDLH